LDLLELDVRLEKDIKHLENSLVDYEKSMSEASAMKYTFESQIKELMQAYEKGIEQLNAKLMRDEELCSRSANNFNEMAEAYEKKWKDIQVQNDHYLTDLDGKVHEKISKLETENKRAWINIVNAQTINEKATHHSTKEAAEGISDEINELLGKNRVIEVSIEAIKTDICKLKSDSERSLINLSAELFKETTRAEDKDRKLAKTFKIFMAISSVLFIVLLIWR